MTNFSQNIFKTFKDCPKRYYFRYIQQISAPQKSTLFEKGKKIHALANYYLRGDDISKLETTLNNEEMAVWTKLKNNVYFNKTCVNSEYNLSCKIENFWVGGRLDALVKENEQYYILDYKTGSIPRDPEYDYQTMVYLLAASYFLQTEKISFVYIDLRNDKNHKIDLTPELKEKYKIELKKVCDIIIHTNEYKPNKNACKYCECKKFCYS
ncbi:PD-(D/E)XK nuclease family protein [bacterium]|nr:PD-(D/E)XK nuclease family protein [bacterium]